MTATPLSNDLITRLHHVEFTVSDLDASIEFYSWLGFSLRMRWNEGPELCEVGLGLPSADIELAQLDGYGITLELIQFHGPKLGATRAAPIHDPGTAHIALVVSDIDQAHHEFIRAGVTVISPPVREQSADWMQIIDPDGIRVEFIAPHAPGTVPIGAVVS